LEAKWGIAVLTVLLRRQNISGLGFNSSNAFAYGSNGITPEFDKIETLLSSLASPNDKQIYFGTFPSEVRSEFVTGRALELVKSYCSNKSLSLGAQSGSERILKIIGRGHPHQMSLTL
jgi:radical SAM superfamily enzyme YgiQ (UPF0313 family)